LWQRVQFSAHNSDPAFFCEDSVISLTGWLDDRSDWLAAEDGGEELQPAMIIAAASSAETPVA
jgi:hypothetical protein